jgi:hypothetical protein
MLERANRLARDNTEGVQSFMQKRQAEFTGNMENSKVTGYPWWMPLDTTGKPKVAPTGKAKL